MLFSFLALAAQSQPTIVRRDLSTTLYNNFKYFAQYAGASYCKNNEESHVNTVVTCIDDVCPDLTSNGVYIIGEFSGAPADQEGFVAIDPKNSLIVISFRGSDSIENFIYDGMFSSTCCEFGDGCQVEVGFWNSWLSVKDIVNSTVAAAISNFTDHKLVMTGHSLGGAVATIAGATMKDNGFDVDIYTYGGPRVFNDVGANYVSAQTKGGNYRITHLNDAVPKLPPIVLGYRHITPEYWLSDGTDITDDYNISDIKICTGIANVNCNAGQLGYDILAHQHYFGPIAACFDLGFGKLVPELHVDTAASNETTSLSDANAK